MERRSLLATYSLFLLLALVNCAGAADESFADQFLGSPLLVLVGLIIIVGLAFVYHRIRK